MSRFSNRSFGLCCLVAVATADSLTALAADITVADGETRGTSQIIFNPGEQVTVEPMGAISTSNSQGIFLLSTDQAATNLGMISISGDQSYGVAADHAHAALIINNGAIWASGRSSGGVLWDEPAGRQRR